MRLLKHIRTVSLFGIMAALSGAVALAQTRTIDTAHSTMTVHVFKTGLFSAFAHNHEISSPISEGNVDVNRGQVSLTVDAAKLRVLDPEASQSDRAQIQKTMEGPEVLDSPKFSKILFHSTTVDPAGKDRWSVRGDLTLHGQTRPVRVEVSLKDGHYEGTAIIRQSDFAIKPINIAGGTVKVKDEVKVEFDVVLAE